MRDITREDYGYSNEYKWEPNRIRPSRSAYNWARKLTQEQLDKIVEMDKLIGFEIDVLVGKKSHSAVIWAVSLPDSNITAHPSGEINKHFNKEFARIFCAYPYEFNLNIKDGGNFWSRNIDNVDLSNPQKTNLTYVKFRDIDDANSIYI